MTEDLVSSNRPPADLTSLVEDECRRAGYPPGARLLRHFANAVYLLDNAPVVARVGYGPRAVARATTSVAVTRWLAEQDFPATAAVNVPSCADQPFVSHRSGQSVVTTFWQFYPQAAGRAWPDTGHLARIASALHGLPNPPVVLPGYQPLRTMAATVSDPAARLALTDEQHAWLVERIEKLRAAFGELSSPLGEGLIHADLYTGNLLWNATDHRHPVVLGDWDSVCVGPREVDLIATYAAPRYGVDPSTVDAFADAYGHDLRQWDGYEVLYDIRELSTLSALIRLAPGSVTLKAELEHRVGLLMSGDRATPWHGQ